MPARRRLQAQVSSLLLCLSLCSCATNDPAFDRSVERRATLERWSRCIDQQSTATSLSEVRARIDIGCDGHRRDVLKTYPPRMSARLDSLLMERKKELLRERLQETQPQELTKTTFGQLD